MSIGQIFGPIIGGFVASFFVPNAQLIGAFFAIICFLLSFKVLKSGIQKENAF